MSILPSFGFILSRSFYFTIFWPSRSENGSRSLLIPVASMYYGNLNIGFKMPRFVWRNLAKLWRMYISDSNALARRLCSSKFLTREGRVDRGRWCPMLKLNQVFLPEPSTGQPSAISSSSSAFSSIFTPLSCLLHPCCPRTRFRPSSRFPKELDSSGVLSIGFSRKPS